MTDSLLQKYVKLALQARDSRTPFLVVSEAELLELLREASENNATPLQLSGNHFKFMGVDVYVDVPIIVK